LADLSGSIDGPPFLTYSWVEGIPMRHLFSFLRSEDGPTSVEYAVMLALIIGVLFATILTIGQTTANSYSHSSGSITSFMSTAS
jgi:pilus assembly protein Flp/PilA